MSIWIRSGILLVVLTSVAAVVAEFDGIDGSTGSYLGMIYGACGSYVAIWSWFHLEGKRFK